MQRNLALELVRVTEAAALAGGKWYGKGDKNAADQVTFIYLQSCSEWNASVYPWLTDSVHCLQAAVDMMRKVLNTVNMDGTIVIGEGEKDEVSHLSYTLHMPLTSLVVVTMICSLSLCCSGADVILR